jgi:hypothetical protein
MTNGPSDPPQNQDAGESHQVPAEDQTKISQSDNNPVATEQKKRGFIKKLLIGVIVLVLVVIAAAALTMNLAISNPEQTAVYPYMTTYSVSFPEGQPIAIGNTKIIVLSYGNEMISDIDGNREKLVVGEERLVSARHGRITTLGFIPLLDTDFKISMKYKGVRDNLAQFDMMVATSKQVPDLLIQRILPPGINAQPAQIS